MNQLEIKKTINREIEKECKKKTIDFPTQKLDENFNLLDSGIFDSLGFLQLLTTLEEELGVEVDLSEYSPDEFTQYNSLIEILAENGFDE